ncbi:MAG TPA: hypothetical protein VJ692_10350 [Nitrospiraceae bacterium]|nr:hypothetical protein [Nitrospiraceae bacterium]
MMPRAWQDAGVGIAALVLLGLVLTIPACIPPPPRANDRTGAVRLPPSTQDTPTLLSGHRRVIGTVQEITADHIKVDVGEVQPLFLSLKQAQDKGFHSIKEGDRLEITLNAQALVVDYHPFGGETVNHRIVKGRISQPLPVGQEYAVIRPDTGQEKGQPEKKDHEQSYAIRPLARSKMAAIPVGVDAVFLIDEADQIADATFGGPEALQQAEEQFRRKSSIKGAHRQVEGTIAEPLTLGRISIRTPDEDVQSYEVRSPVEERLDKLEKGRSVILLLDTDNQVIDAAVPPSP